MKRRGSILVLNYNGKHLLKEYLPSIVAAVEYAGGGHEIAVVDNASTDGSVEFVRQEFPAVKVHRMVHNRRLFSYNQVVRECNSDYVFLMNNDVRVEKDFIPSLLAHFSGPAVFAVMPRIESDEPNERYITRCVGSFSHGLLGSGRDQGVTGRGFSLYAHCASCYDRDKFLNLGGFDWLFWPEYGPELDISYRAWVRGWKILFEPGSSVFHAGGRTLGTQFSDDKKKALMLKTTMLFMLKNISDVRMLASFAAWSLARLGKALITIDRYRLGIFWELFRLMPSILASRRRAQAGRRLPDKLILQRIRRGSSGDCAGGA